MQGTEADDGELSSKGIIPRVFEYLFDRIKVGIVQQSCYAMP